MLTFSLLLLVMRWNVWLLDFLFKFELQLGDFLVSRDGLLFLEQFFDLLCFLDLLLSLDFPCFGFINFGKSDSSSYSLSS